MTATQGVIALDEREAKARKDTLETRAQELDSFRRGRLTDQRRALKTAWDKGGGSDALAEAESCGKLFAEFLHDAFLRLPRECDFLAWRVGVIMDTMGEVEAGGVSDFGGQSKALEGTQASSPAWVPSTAAPSDDAAPPKWVPSTGGSSSGGATSPDWVPRSSNSSGSGAWSPRR
ncbi:MAG: hypothetical protein LBT54_07930 [Bifidobacteriaceae bacterium]|nr:hypothetical protein [Bifidobacteriaceae bacterium]